MKTNNLLTTVIFVFFLLFQNIFSQHEIAKSWEGSLDVGMGNKLRLVLHITKTNDGKLAATLDSPDQMAKGIKIDSVIFYETNIKLVSLSIGGTYEGMVNQDFTEIKGEWRQAGRTFPLILKPADDSATTNLEVISLWQGKLKAGESELGFIFRFYKAGSDSIGAFLESPDPGAPSIKATKVFYGDDSVFVEVKNIGGYYIGKFNGEKTKIDGKWNQSGMTFPLLMEKIEKVEQVKRPQEPKRPFPYNEEEITFENKEAGITLTGTFTYPKQGSNFPVVVLVTGSGPQNRDEELLGHKPFLVWSDHLTRNGIAVLRYDDRGIGKSTGNFSGATTMDFTMDAIAAVNYLKSRKEVAKEKIGIVGHSEGGFIAPIAANKCSDVAFIILAAGPAVPGDQIVLLQAELISRKLGVPEKIIKENTENNKKAFDAVKNAKDSLDASEKLDMLFSEIYNSLPDSEKTNSEFSKENVEGKKKEMLSRWFVQLLKYDPRTELVKLNIPVLAMYGENDLQVPPSQNKGEMENVLKKSESKNYKVVVLPGLNHIFQECKTGTPIEYAQIEQTASPKMLETMAGWIKEVTQ